MKGKLAEPMNEEQAKILLQSGRHASFWIGINDIKEEGKWVAIEFSSFLCLHLMIFYRQICVRFYRKGYLPRSAAVLD